MDIKNPSGRFYCAFRRDTNETNATALEKERATAKSNARRAGNGWEGASEMAWTLARDGSSDMCADTTGKVSAGGVLTVDGVNRHP